MSDIAARIDDGRRKAARAGYGDALRQRLAADLTPHFGRGFSRRNLDPMCRFYLGWKGGRTLSGDPGRVRVRQPASGESAHGLKRQTASAKSVGRPKAQTVSGQSPPPFPLPWSHYVVLLSVESPEARAFYEAEALRGGWTVCQLKPQVSTQFHERTLLWKDKVAMLRKGRRPTPEDAVAPKEQIRDPFMLEFLDPKDEYSATELEQALIRRLETFLLGPGSEFACIGRQRRLRIDDAWYRVDLFYSSTVVCVAWS